MKRLILSSLSVLLLSTTAAPAVQAQTTAADTMPANAETIGMAVTPFNLVFLAYQGFFESQGIPKFNALITEHQEGRVTAQDLVRVAIGMHRLTPDTINNRGYLSSVERQLDSLYTSSGDR